MKELSYEALRKEHQRLLKEIEASETRDKIVSEVEAFINNCVEAGSYISDEEERDALRAMLLHWGDFVYSVRKVYPDTKLAPSLDVSKKLILRMRQVVILVVVIFAIIACQFIVWVIERSRTQTVASATATAAVATAQAVAEAEATAAKEIAQASAGATATAAVATAQAMADATATAEAPFLATAIESPIDGDFVDFSQQIKVKYRGLKEGSKIYVIVQHPPDDKWWPQSEPREVKKSGGEWSASAQFGESPKGDAGEAFDLFVVVIAPKDRAADQKLSKASAEATAIAPIPDAKVEQRISVRRWPIVYIEDPKDGELVDYRQIVTGTFSGSLAGLRIYGFVQPVLENVMYPQTTEIDEEQGVWSITAARFGDEEKHRDKELAFFVGIAQTDAADKKLNDAFRKGITITELPPGVFKYEKQIIKVKRK